MSSKSSDGGRISVVSAFSELAESRFQGNVNAICWHRNLTGDFREVVSKLNLAQNITEVCPEMLLALQLSIEGNRAREVILDDLRALTELGASPALNLIRCYERDQELDFISTDVYSYHVDRSPVPTDTFLCTYYGPASEILPNEQATQMILIPEIREKLSEFHSGPESEFEAFLNEHHFDLHYLPAADARAVNSGVGHLWKLAVDHPEQSVLPCVHRAPLENEGEYRLLLIC